MISSEFGPETMLPPVLSDRELEAAATLIRQIVSKIAAPDSPLHELRVLGVTTDCMVVAIGETASNDDRYVVHAAPLHKLVEGTPIPEEHFPASGRNSGRWRDDGVCLVTRDGNPILIPGPNESEPPFFMDRPIYPLDMLTRQPYDPFDYGKAA